MLRIEPIPNRSTSLDIAPTSSRTGLLTADDRTQQPDSSSRQVRQRAAEGESPHE
jgi:hypothetical protein